jgi:GNAT superfamily N-acetyltransferase
MPAPSKVQLPADIVIRRPTAADGPAIEAMFARCSLDSRYRRFHAPVVKIPAVHLERILDPGSADEAWLGVTRDDPDTVIALGSWTRSGTDGELAILVEDAWQRRGIGSAFVALLADAAWNAGVCRVTAWVFRESRHVLRMLRAVLGPVATAHDGAVSHVTIDRCPAG